MDWRTATLIGQAGLLAVVLTGCSRAPAPQTYSLPVAASPTLLRAAVTLPGVLIVNRFAADSVLNSRRIAWRSSPVAFTVGHYPEQRWSMAPPEQLQTRLVRCLTTAGAAETVAPDSAPAPADWILSGRLIYFEQQLTGPADKPGNAQARVGAELLLTQVRNDRKPVWQGVIDVTAPLPDADPARIAEGMQEALGLFCARLVQELNLTLGSPQRS